MLKRTKFIVGLSRLTIDSRPTCHRKVRQGGNPIAAKSTMIAPASLASHRTPPAIGQRPGGDCRHNRRNGDPPRLCQEGTRKLTESERISEGFHLIESSGVVPRGAEAVSLWLLDIREFEFTGSLAVCGKIIVARWKFNGPHISGNRRTARRMLKKAGLLPPNPGAPRRALSHARP